MTLPLKTIVGEWQPFDPNNRETWPPFYGRYLVYKQNGTLHFEVWNGTGWAYNHKSITHYTKIVPPTQKIEL